MITVSILGVDVYLALKASKEMTPHLSELYEVPMDQINFYAPESLIIHNGVEQNERNILVRVHAPRKFKALQKNCAQIIYEFLKDICVHCSVEFFYYDEENRFEFVNNEYPLFMTESNSVEIVEDENDDEESEKNPEEEPYLGNIFEDFEKRMNGD